MSERYCCCYDNVLRNLRDDYTNVIVQFGVVRQWLQLHLCILGVTRSDHRNIKKSNQLLFTSHEMVHKVYPTPHFTLREIHDIF